MREIPGNRFVYFKGRIRPQGEVYVRVLLQTFFQPKEKSMSEYIKETTGYVVKLWDGIILEKTFATDPEVCQFIFDSLDYIVGDMAWQIVAATEVLTGIPVIQTDERGRAYYPVVKKIVE